MIEKTKSPYVIELKHQKILPTKPIMQMIFESSEYSVFNFKDYLILEHDISKSIKLFNHFLDITTIHSIIDLDVPNYDKNTMLSRYFGSGSV